MSNGRTGLIDLEQINADKAKENENIAEELGLVSDKISHLAGKMAEQIKQEQDYLMKQYKKLSADHIDVMGTLNSFPDRIKEQKEIISELEEKVDQAKEEADLIESTMELQISQAENENGKRKFSNKSMRSAELKRRKKESDEYQEAKEALKTAKKELEQAEFEKDRIYNEYKSAKSQARMLEARMNLLAGI